MATFSLEHAQTSLTELVHRLHPGDEVFITENDRTVATLVMTSPETRDRLGKIPRLGTLQGTVLSMEHFDDPLEEFEEYS